MGWLDNWRKEDEVDLRAPVGWLSLQETFVVFDARENRHGVYADILCNEVKKRSRVSWSMGTEAAPAPDTVNRIELVKDCDAMGELGAEGYSLRVRHGSDGCVVVEVKASTDRGVLFGIGRLLREMKLDFSITYASELTTLVALRTDLSIVSRPKYEMRQHQVAYRPKTNSYDSFTPEMMRQEVLDLALFGTNGIEMIPPGIDDAMQSPNFTVPWLEMLNIVSTWCDQLDIRVSVWYPAFFKKYETREEISTAEEHWRTVFSAMPRLDVLFVPGGDPGGRPAEELFKVVELQAAFARAHFFPELEVWVSSQYGLSTSIDLGLTEPWVPLVQEQQWMDVVRQEHTRSFLNGVVYGPWSCVPISEFRAQIPKEIPLRNYPDLCHVQTAEMPVYGWDLSFACTNGRESINPRPREMANIIKSQAKHTIGCGCYSEGVNDDVNKYVWTCLHWGEDVSGPLAGASMESQLDAAMSHYVGFLMEQTRNVEMVVQGIYALESNWKGDLFRSTSVVESQRIFTELQSRIVPRHRRNWRLNMMLFRANYDALLYTRLCQSFAAEAQAVATVVSSGSSVDALTKACEHLAVPYSEPAMTQSSFNSPSTPNPLNITLLSGAPSVTHLYGQLMALAATLYHQIGYQLSVGYGGQHRQRGAYFDMVWSPIGDVVYLNRVFKSIQDAVTHHDSPSLDETQRALVERFTVSLNEHSGIANKTTLWYASFGDPGANELPGTRSPPTRPIPIEHVLPPHRPLRNGEDPVYFARPLTEYLDCSNDEIMKELHDGRIPRAWRSYIEPIWPRTASLSMQFSLAKLLPFALNEETLAQTKLTVRITYLGNDLNRHGGDWEELGREAMPVRLKANGFTIHDYIPGPQITKIQEFEIPSEALVSAAQDENLILSFQPLLPDKITFRYVPIPIAELWILMDKPLSSNL